MINEVNSVVDFVSGLLRQRKVPADVLDRFGSSLTDILCLHYHNHWFPDKPFRGSAYRCVRVVNKVMDPVLLRAGEAVGLSLADLLKLLPSELTLWVDPNDVSYRIGEDGSIGILYSPGSGDDNSNDSQEDSSTAIFPSCKDHDRIHPRLHFSAESSDWDRAVGVVSG